MTRRELLAVAVLVIVGGILVLNPLYAAPGGGGEIKVTYSVSEIPEDATTGQALGLDERVLHRSGSPECPLETLAANESITCNSSISLASPPQVSEIDGRFYRSRYESDNGTRTLTLEPITEMEAVATLAIPAEDLGPHVQTAVETGSVTVYDEAAHIVPFDRGWIVEHDGRYYQQDRSSSTTQHLEKPSAVMGLRAVLWVLGIASVLHAGRMYERVTRAT